MVLAGLVIFGGVQRIANVTQLLVPFMAGAYILVGLAVIVLNINLLPGVIAEIVGQALGFREIVGGTLWGAISYGIQRGLFSNEAGEGSVPNAAATATVSHPVKQGLVQTLGVYFDTLLVCSITAFIILFSGIDYVGADSASLTQYALADVVGQWGIHFITVVMFFLAFTSLIGNYYLAESNVKYLNASPGVVTGFRVAVLAAVFFGAMASVPLIWALGDIFAAVMVIINLSAIIPLGALAGRLRKNYAAQKTQGIDPVFHRDMLPDVKNIEAWDGTDAATTRYMEGFEALERSRMTES